MTLGVRIGAFSACLLIAAAACTRDYDAPFADTQKTPANGDGGRVKADSGSGATDDDGSAPTTDGSTDGQASTCPAKSCQTQHCDVRCTGEGCACNETCAAGTNCTFECKQGARCNFTCADNASGCDVTCLAGSTCKVFCEKQPCSLRCEGDASCSLICSGGGSCEPDCANGAGETSCGNGIKGCNVCPP